MPAYNTFNLATQSRNRQPPNTTLNYYSSLNRPNPIGNQLGNQTGTNVTSTDRSTWDQRYMDRANAQIQQANTDGARSFAGEGNFLADPTVYNKDNFTYTGILDDDDPYVQMFKRQFGERQFVDENGNPMQNQGSQGGAAGGYRIIGANTPIYYGLDDNEYLQDGSRVLTLPDGRRVIEVANYSGGAVAGAQRAQETSSRQFTQRAIRNLALMVAGGYLGGTVLAGAGEAGGVYGGMQGTGGGMFADWAAPTLAEGAGTGAGVGTASQVGVPNAAAEIAANAGTSVVPPNLPAFPTGAAEAIPSLAAPPAVQATSALPYGLTMRDLATAGSGVMNLINSSQARRDAAAAANRADTWGEDGRQFAKDKLFELFNNPDSIKNTPGYQFSVSQGEQGINRNAAKLGYARSGNKLYDISKFNSELAQKTWNDEYNKYAQMAGLSFNPNSAAAIQAQGSQTSQNMRSAGVTQLGSSFFDWLSRQG